MGGYFLSRECHVGVGMCGNVGLHYTTSFDWKSSSSTMPKHKRIFITHAGIKYVQYLFKHQSKNILTACLFAQNRRDIFKLILATFIWINIGECCFV